MNFIERVIDIFQKAESDSQRKNRLIEIKDTLNEVKLAIEKRLPELAKEYNSFVSRTWDMGEKDYRNHMWISYADNRFEDPRRGIQLQFGLGEVEEHKYGVFVNGIWIQGDGTASEAKSKAASIIRAEKDTFLNLFRNLGSNFVFKWHEKDGEQRKEIVSEKNLDSIIRIIEDRKKYVQISFDLDYAGKSDDDLVEAISEDFSTLYTLYKYLFCGEVKGLETKFNAMVLSLYQKTKDEIGYSARRFLRAVKEYGALTYAKKMLQKHVSEPLQQQGFRTIVEANRPDLLVESIVLRTEYRSLFTSKERAEAKYRLETISGYITQKEVLSENLHPEELDTERDYTEGAKKKVVVNAYERDSRARVACIKKFWYKCYVCDMTFLDIYGPLGKEFIHVHHIRPLAGMREEYKVDPSRDLKPVCPNCHAMLHRKDPPIPIEDLRKLISSLNMTRKTTRPH